jgi:hypothetical protein
VGTKTPSSKDTVYEKMKLKYPPWNSPNPQKHLRFLSFQTLKNVDWHHLPNRSTSRPSRLPPTSKQVDNSSRHNPRHTKTSKNVIPQSVSHITVKKKVVHRFLITLAQATSVHNDFFLISKKNWVYTRTTKFNPQKAFNKTLKPKSSTWEQPTKEPNKTHKELSPKTSKL